MLFDYPHFPLISEGLISGFTALSIAAIIYVLLFGATLASPRLIVAQDVPEAFMLTTNVTAISGDTMLSVRQCAAVAVLLMTCTASPRQETTYNAV